MEFLIDGVDFASYLTAGGLRWQRNDLDGANAGRTLDGRMHRDRVATKSKLTVQLRPLTDGELGRVLRAIAPQYVTVTYPDPQAGRRTAVFYSNNAAAEATVACADGTLLWTNIQFPLIER